MKGISGFLFVTVTSLILLGLFWAGVAIAPAVSSINTAAVVTFISHAFLKFVVVGLGTLLFGYAFFHFVLDKRFVDLHDLLNEPNNLSYAVCIAAIMGAVAIPVVFASGSSLGGYLYFVLTKGALGALLGLWVTVILSFLWLRVNSMDAFRDAVVAPHNNQKVIVLAVIFNVAMLAAML